MPQTDPAEILIVANPVAGGYSPRRLQRLADRLDRLGHRSTIRLTRFAGELIEIAEEMPQTVMTLVVGGGDGSINEAISGLIRRREGRLPRLAVLPFGTANVLAAELRLPSTANGLSRAIVAGKTKPLHLGMIGDRPFALMVSAGYDADVVHAVEGPAKKRWGKLAYVAAALARAAKGGGRDVVVDADGVRSVVRTAVVTTAACYGGPYRITRQTRADLPGLRLVTLADDRPLTLFKAAIGLALGRLDTVPGATDRSVDEVRLSGDGILMQIDGDTMETSDATIRAGRTIEIVG